MRGFTWADFWVALGVCGVVCCFVIGVVVELSR